MEFKNPYLSITTRIEMLQKWVLVHSAIYYEHDKSVVPDHMYDMNMVQLTKLMKEHPQEAKKSKYSSCFKGFDGSTGFDLIKRLTKREQIKIKNIAAHVVDICERRR